MDKKIHLADTSERIRKKYRVKEISVKQQKYKKNQDDHSYSAAPQKSSAEKAKHSENYSTYHNAHKKNTVKNDEARSHYSEEDNSAEKEKYRKQMQYTACQQKASEISEKLSSDIQENIQMSKRQASISSYESEAPSKKQYDDKTKEAAAMLASRIAGDVLRKTHITENNDSQTKSGTASKSQRVTFYLNSNQIEKARLTKPNSEARKRFNKAAENTYKERKKLDVAIDKENCKLKKYHKEEKKLEKQASKHYTSAFEKAENILYLEGKISSAANKGSTGESAAALSSAAAEIALKKVVETVAQKHKSIGEMSRAAGAVAELSSSIDNENSIGSATASSVTAVPKYYIAQKAADTVKKTSEKHYKDKLEKKREALRQKQKAAEHRIEELKKEQAKRQQKINIYKSENGITSKNNTTLQNVKAVIKSQQNAAKAAVVAKSSATVIAAAGGAIIPIICIIVVIFVIIALFSWLMPHEETFYNEVDNTWEPVMVETTDEVLKGYLRHIQDYFDKKQLEILEVVDINFDGFAPDKYDYPYEEGRGDVLDFTDMPKLTTECTKYFIERTVQYYKVDDEDETALNPSDLEEETIREESGYPLLRKEYYKFDYDLGYEVRSTSTDYDFTRTYTLIALDIESYWNSLNENEGEDNEDEDEDKNVYSCDNGIFSVKQDITDEVMTLTRDGEIIYSGNVLDYVLSHPEMFKHTVPISLSPEEINDNLISDVTNWFEEDEIEVIKDNQYEFDNYIWNLYEYGNRWIKLSDDCGFESIIALAATKKWQEIEAENFNSETYSFEITDEDLDYCLDSLFEFYYSYSRGRCSGNDCHRYYVGDPPEAHYICDRASSHKHLIGQVTNFELIGGIDMVLNKILKVPQRADYASDQEYDEAKAKFETDKDIYYVYVEYLKDELGTSTKLSDYENDREAQYRLLRMHQAGHGKKPSNPPTNVTCNAFKRTVSPGHLYYDTAEHYFIDVTWNAPAPEEYAKGKFVEIQGYKVYAYDRSAGTKRLLADVPGTSAHIDYGIGDTGGENSTYDKDGTKIWRYFAGPTFTNIIVVAYNNGGSGPASDPVYVAMK